MSQSVEDCLFCRIIEGKIPCAKVYENEHIFAFLDIAPCFEGHCLVIPKKHCSNMLEMDSKLAEHLFDAIKRIVPGIMDTTHATGFNVIQNNFASAGQTVFHAHWHIIPRVEGDNFAIWDPCTYKSKEDMENIAERIRLKAL